ncbi:hypothetical protein EJ05DRAFT_241026 [Pseudovirgaria hyperparasitica]|uniref:MARVEL domain-containing protein n=1 Tax=Pseudovirgaria hyperparasitica TaxID=470096 RepID=A0A6A6WEZ3_9PEZI|nr:uncharacterized protein EJ05DRAFT_241026 [Pseudovirgaria hyperparasitica]KAF2760729.1 hypothetical protein EJ05DRAFT_241026 [Pseudovirgaria hyperparasitica]
MAQPLHLYPTGSRRIPPYATPSQPAPVFAAPVMNLGSNMTRAASPSYNYRVPSRDLGFDKQDTFGGGIKTMHLVQQYRYDEPCVDRYASGNGMEERPPVYAQSVESEEQMRALNGRDQRLKRHIRVLRFVSRILAFVVSVLVFVPITITLVTFLRTNDISRVVTIASPGTAPQTVSRTAWAQNSTTWPTYMYFGTAAVSLLLNLFIMIAYLRTDVRTANRTAYVATTFSWVVMVGNAVVWAVAASLYRQQKKNDDLWGWTCSSAAQAIQKVFENEVKFEQQCNIQSFSWYAGIVQALLAILTIVVLVLVVRRRETKRGLERGDSAEVLLADKN